MGTMLYRWVASTWGKCSVTCGEGQHSRNVHCWLMMAPGFDSTVHEYVCSSLKKPTVVKNCRQVECGPVWESSEWSEVRHIVSHLGSHVCWCLNNVMPFQCSHMCGPGVRRREIRCSSNALSCNSSLAPPVFQRCNNGPCHHTWIVSDWSEVISLECINVLQDITTCILGINNPSLFFQCSGSCGEGLMRRSVTCQDSNTGEFDHDKYCDEQNRPLSFKACGDKPNCQPVWVPQDWGVVCIMLVT